MTFAEELRSRFATRDELAELQKAIDNTMQTAVEDTLVPDADRTDDGKLPTADVMITVDYDAELQRLVYHQSPFLTYLETHGCVRPASTAKVGYRVKKQMTCKWYCNGGDCGKGLPGTPCDLKNCVAWEEYKED